MPKIVVLDGFALNPGDLSWSSLQSLGETTIYDRTMSYEVAERCQSAEIIVTNKVRLEAALIKALPHLKAIMVSATGHDVVDGYAAQLRGIPVCNVAGYGPDAVAQHTFALLLSLINRVGEYQNDVQAGGWTQRGDWCYYLYYPIELSGKTIGLIGFGQIAKRVARIAIGFGMKVVAYTPRPKHHPSVHFLPLDEVFQISDVVSLHCPLTASNANMVNAGRLALMYPSAYLINTARGGLVDEKALQLALFRKQIAGAALDVLSVEPPPIDHPLLGIENCIITPHVAWAAYETRKRLLGLMVENIRAFLAGKPINVVNG
ncbi:MAG: D-2-hydroxyacid dehydrogenase [Bacteroidetes Order II. Incertae sedis bacterium]|nr:D-2-hydroxyacid dehydrogenase [Bacteroidetes Order II. bacterium]